MSEHDSTYLRTCLSLGVPALNPRALSEGHTNQPMSFPVNVREPLELVELISQHHQFFALADPQAKENCCRQYCLNTGIYPPAFHIHTSSRSYASQIEGHRNGTGWPWG